MIFATKLISLEKLEMTTPKPRFPKLIIQLKSDTTTVFHKTTTRANKNKSKHRKIPTPPATLSQVGFADKS